jgi:hypothetical protein
MLVVLVSHTQILARDRSITIPSDFLDAIMMVESGGDPNAVGDGGKAIGAFQIHRGYWKDAVAFDKTLGGTYHDCFDPAYARRVVVAYMRRYAPAGATMEDMARLHNGGCNILKRKGSKAWDATTAYWNKVRKHL